MTDSSGDKKLESWSLLAEAKLTDEQLKAVGCLALESTHLEEIIEMVIQDLCSFDENQQRVFIGRLTIEPKATIMRDLLWPHIENTPRATTFSEIYGDIKNLISKRNTVIHGEWAGPVNALAAFASMKRGDSSVAKKRWSAVTVKSDEIMDLALRFANRRQDLILWLLDYLSASVTSHHKPER